MDATRTTGGGAASDRELKLDFSGLLGSGQIFAAGNDPKRQAELIDAHGNKIGVEGGCCSVPVA